MRCGWLGGYMRKSWLPFRSQIAHIWWLPQFSQNFHIQLEVITRTDLLEGYDYAILSTPWTTQERLQLALVYCNWIFSRKLLSVPPKISGRTKKYHLSRFQAIYLCCFATFPLFGDFQEGGDEGSQILDNADVCNNENGCIRVS